MGADAEAAVKDLDNRRVQGCKDKLRAYEGDLAADGKLGKYQGRGQYGGDRGGRDSRSPPRRSPPRRRYSRSRTPPRRRSPPRRDSGKGGDEEIMTLFVKDMPDDVREDEIKEEIGKSAQVLRAMIMRKDDYCSAFVRFESVKDAERAMDDLNDGAVKVGGSRVRAEMARRNTSV